MKKPQGQNWSFTREVECSEARPVLPQMPLKENAKMKMNRKYRTSDLYVAAYLLSLGLELLGVYHSDRRRCNFIFLDREDRGDSVRAFMCGQAHGNIPDFIYHQKRAKRLLFSGEV